MCRLAAYLGEELPLKTLLLEPKHSLYAQSWQPKELNYAKLNADGFGFGWYRPDGTPAMYRSHAPIWSDPNLDDLGDALRAPLWIAMVRSATGDYGSSPMNAQPFRRGRLLFVHNGFIRDFNRGARQAIVAELSDALLEDIHGLTDSEYLFALLCRFDERRGDDLATALADVVEWCRRNLGDKPAMLNTIVTDGERLCAVRAALGADAPSLYHAEQPPSGFPAGTRLIASERLTDDGSWREVPADHLLTIERGRPPALTPLPVKT